MRGDDAAIEGILFQQVLDGLLNLTWNEKVDPPIPTFSLTEKGQRQINSIFGVQV